jgi:protein-S-isoprenylcysteine O-methyltransferase Ste14
MSEPAIQVSERGRPGSASWRRSILAKTLLDGLLVAVVAGAILFLSAGRLDLPMFWVYLGAQLLYFFLFSLPHAGRDPAMMEERLKSRARPKEVRRLPTRLVPQLILVVAGLDVGRFHWSSPIPLPVEVAALCLSLLGIGMTTWSLRTNTYFSNHLRVQHERGHRVITTGPYRYIRHPGYAGMVSWYTLSAVALGSWWALVPAAATLALFVVRTLREERMLFRDLEGYREYAERVRYRLLPAVW